jgi:ABC-type multidrug transport system ATPase subunit
MTFMDAAHVPIAAALLGDPQVLVLDEPVNGLDPQGVRWIRNLLKEFAAQGRTVLVSSHLMTEMAVTADHLPAGSVEYATKPAALPRCVRPAGA